MMFTRKDKRDIGIIVAVLSPFSVAAGMFLAALNDYPVTTSSDVAISSDESVPPMNIPLPLATETSKARVAEVSTPTTTITNANRPVTTTAPVTTSAPAPKTVSPTAVANVRTIAPVAVTVTETVAKPKPRMACRYAELSDPEAATPPTDWEADANGKCPEFNYYPNGKPEPKKPSEPVDQGEKPVVSDNTPPMAGTP